MDNPKLTILLTAMTEWQAVLDILLIAAGLFFLYRTFLRLGTWRIVAGIIFAMFIFLIANFLDFKGLEWIFDNLSQVAVVALIVIFQPELRKIFERTVSVRRSEIRDVGAALSQTIANSMIKLAEQRQGAIIVFPGKEPIEEWLSGGHKLDAKPSDPLIMSIFDSSSPGHDGALIVQNGKFSRFGVRLPLSQSSKLPEDLGTRHHAAMGIAERADALAIAVSEERGIITIFSKGKFKQESDRNKLVEAILSHWNKTASVLLRLPERKARGLTLLQMTVSLALAVIFWSTLIISQREILEKVLTVPVGYTASPPNLILIGDKQKEVRLHLTGSKSDFDSIDFSQLNVKIDLSKTDTGKQTFPINNENIRLPRGLKILDVIPSSIELTLAEIEERIVTIKPQLIGKLPGGMKILSIDVIPNTVKIRSPVGEEKNEIVNVITTPVYLESMYNDMKIFAKIIAPPAAQPVDKRWPDVKIEIKVGY